jgi:hypothetical protein
MTDIIKTIQELNKEIDGLNEKIDNLSNPEEKMELLNHLHKLLEKK